MTWGIGPYLRGQGWGSWTDLVINSMSDGTVASIMYFYAVPAMNNAFINSDKVNDPNATLNPDINIIRLMQMFGAVSAVAWTGRRVAKNRDQAKPTAKKTVDVEDKDELMAALEKMVKSNSLE